MRVLKYASITVLAATTAILIVAGILSIVYLYQLLKFILIGALALCVMLVP